MATPAPDQAPIAAPLSRGKQAASKAAVLVLLSLLLGLGHGWAVPRLYGRERVANIHLGVLHGALMPAALPALLMGKDLPIYAPNNTGRPYNIGYILGLNLCGTLFFGVAFRWPRRA